MRIISCKRPSVKHINKNIIEKNVTGTIIEQNGAYVVSYNDVFYRIHPSSLKTQGVRRVYAKDELNRWFIYDRVIAEERRQMPPMYIPFKPKFECIGNIITDNGVTYFKIKKSYNPHDVDSKVQAIKEIENENESCE